MNRFFDLESSLSAYSLHLGLLAGTGLLAVALLLLAVTKWGYVSPIWKCVILSMMAHVLLVFYALGTYLIPEFPDELAHIGPVDNMKIHLFDDDTDGPSANAEFRDDTAIPAWNETRDFSWLSSVSDNLVRPEINSQIVIERHSITESPLTSVAETEFKPSLPEPELERSSPQIESDFQPELVLPNRDLTPLPSQEIEVDRLRQTDQASLEIPRFETSLLATRTDSSQELKPLDVPIERPENDFSEAIAQNKQTKLAATELVESKLPLPDLTPPPGAISGLKPLFRPSSFDRNSADAGLKRVGNPRRLADGKPMPGEYSLRQLDRREIAQQRGGSIDTERAVASALKWLSDSQETDGRWSPTRWGGGRETLVFGHDRKGAGAQADCGITGLAMLAFLAAGNSQLEGPYRDQVSQAIDFLIRQQKIDGDLAGEARLFARMYCHSMALLALSEALAMTGDQRLLIPVQRGVNFTLSAQNRNDGGWRYQPSDAGDMSQFGWKVLALHSAELGGIEIPPAKKELQLRFLQLCTSGKAGGLAGYRPGDRPSSTMTAEALLCRFILEKNVDPKTIMEAAQRITADLPSINHRNYYYWYYATMALYHAGGPEWELWNQELTNVLLQSQIHHGDLAGSWEPDSVWGGYGGRVYTTALAALNLQVYYRYLPSSRLAEGETDPLGSKHFLR